MMTKYALAYEVNVTTGEIIERERTAEELAQEADEQAELMVRDAEANAEAAAKAEARAALLDRLGITADEAALLLG